MYPVARKERRPRFDAIRRDGDNRNFELIVRKFEMIPERSIWLELNRSAGNSDFRLRIGSAVEDHFRVHVHEKFAFGLCPKLAPLQLAPLQLAPSPLNRLVSETNWLQLERPNSKPLQLERLKLDNCSDPKAALERFQLENSSDPKAALGTFQLDNCSDPKEKELTLYDPKAVSQLESISLLRL